MGSLSAFLHDVATDLALHASYPFPAGMIHCCIIDSLDESADALGWLAAFAYGTAALSPTMDIANAIMFTVPTILLFGAGYLLRWNAIPRYLLWCAAASADFTHASLPGGCSILILGVGVGLSKPACCCCCCCWCWQTCAASLKQSVYIKCKVQALPSRRILGSMQHAT